MNKEYDPLASVQAAGPPGSISFMYGLPDPETFPVDHLQRCFSRIFQEKSSLALQYGPEQGYGPLIDYLRQKISRSDGIDLHRPQIKLTEGSTQALDYICTLFTQTGDLILVEAPSYNGALQLFRDHDLRLIQIPMDEEGLRVDTLADRLAFLEKKGEKVRFLYTIPSFQNPSGVTLSEQRKRSLIDIAKEWDLLIVEDDVYCDLSYEEFNIPTLYALDDEKHVLRIGSFSKIMAPGLRLGWLIGPEEFIQPVIDCGFRCMGGGANPLVAIALSYFCQEGLLESHIESLRKVYSQRRDIMLDALESCMPESVHYTRPKGGFFIWLTLPSPLQSEDVVDAANKERVLILSGDRFFAERPRGQHLRLAFSYVEAEKIKEGIEKLGSIIKSFIE